VQARLVDSLRGGGKSHMVNRAAHRTANDIRPRATIPGIGGYGTIDYIDD
jgi:hypothetical protein